MVIQVQSVKELPRNKYPNAKVPALKIKIAYAKRGSQQEKNLIQGESSNTITLDISFNELIEGTQSLEIADGELLHAYSRIHLIAEKYRAVLQQPSRDRNRRQDVYDLDILIRELELDSEKKATVLRTLTKKCESRGIHPHSKSIDDPDIKVRSGTDWDALKLEIWQVPDFDSCFERVATFYRQLPWPIKD